ncbi:MAG: hypothetical protein ACXAAH_12575 [Promethearchaeota archaeon]
MANITIKIIDIKSITGKEIRRNNMIFKGEYSKIFLFEIRDNRNKNIRNTKKGRKIKIPIIETIGMGLGISAVPIKSQITRAVNLQFLPIFFKLSMISIKNKLNLIYLNFLIQLSNLKIKLKP